MNMAPLERQYSNRYRKNVGQDRTSTSMGQTATSLLTVALQFRPQIHTTVITTTAATTTIIITMAQSTPTMLWSSKETTTMSISVDDPHCPTLTIAITTITTTTTTTMAGVTEGGICLWWIRITISVVVHLTQGMKIMDTITTTIIMDITRDMVATTETRLSSRATTTMLAWTLDLESLAINITTILRNILKQPLTKATNTTSKLGSIFLATSPITMHRRPTTTSSLHTTPIRIGLRSILVQF